tara:strand:+ start:617 stop:847 length:231 start_codon:yes stop_codon:yes gene_type:complete
MNIITFYAVLISICIDENFNILKVLLSDYVEKKIGKHKKILLYIKIANIDKNSDFYLYMKKWIIKNKNIITKQLII